MVNIPGNGYSIYLSICQHESHYKDAGYWPLDAGSLSAICRWQAKTKDRPFPNGQDPKSSIKKPESSIPGS